MEVIIDGEEIARTALVGHWDDPDVGAAVAEAILRVVRDLQPARAFSVCFDGPNAWGGRRAVNKRLRPPASYRDIVGSKIACASCESINSHGAQVVSSEGATVLDVAASLLQSGRGEALIVGSSRYLHQLIDDRVTLLTPIGRGVRGVEWVRRGLGVEPEQLADVLAIAGDPEIGLYGIDVSWLTAAAWQRTSAGFRGALAQVGAVAGERGVAIVEENRLVLGKRQIESLPHREGGAASVAARMARVRILR